jgi:hypothetical protein
MPPNITNQYYFPAGVEYGQQGFGHLKLWLLHYVARDLVEMHPI